MEKYLYNFCSDVQLACTGAACVYSNFLIFIYSFFVNFERDKSKAHCQNRLVIHIYRILLLTKFSNVLLF